MNQISKLSKVYKIYQPIIKEMLKLKEVKKADLIEDHGNLSIRLTNNKTGKALRCFFFPVRQALKINIIGSPINNFDYDLMDLEDPHIIVALGIKKAEKCFS